MLLKFPHLIANSYDESLLFKEEMNAKLQLNFKEK